MKTTDRKIVVSDWLLVQWWLVKELGLVVLQQRDTVPVSSKSCLRQSIKGGDQTSSIIVVVLTPVSVTRSAESRVVTSEEEGKVIRVEVDATVTVIFLEENLEFEKDWKAVVGLVVEGVGRRWYWCSKNKWSERRSQGRTLSFSPEVGGWAAGDVLRECWKYCRQWLRQCCCCCCCCCCCSSKMMMKSRFVGGWLSGSGEVTPRSIERSPKGDCFLCFLLNDECDSFFPDALTKKCSCLIRKVEMMTRFLSQFHGLSSHRDTLETGNL